MQRYKTNLKVGGEENIVWMSCVLDHNHDHPDEENNLERQIINNQLKRNK